MHYFSKRNNYKLLLREKGYLCNYEWIRMSRHFQVCKKGPFVKEKGLLCNCEWILICTFYKIK